MKFILRFSTALLVGTVIIKIGHTIDDTFFCGSVAGVVAAFFIRCVFEVFA